MSRQAARVETLFLHERQGDYLVVAQRDGERLFRAVLNLKETSAGPRPARFRIKSESDEEPRAPEEFVEIARRAERIRISQQTSKRRRTELQEMLSGYQLEATRVRTCRLCANQWRYGPITDETAVKSGSEYICRDCAVRELERELAFSGGFSGAAEERLEELLFEVGDLDRIVDLQQGELDPDLTKFDEISATTDDVDLVPVDTLDLHPGIQSHLESRSTRSSRYRASPSRTASSTATTSSSCPRPRPGRPSSES